MTSWRQALASREGVELGASLLPNQLIGFGMASGVEPGEHVGLFGFGGASAHLAIRVREVWKCAVYVSTRGKSHRQLAASLGATWVGAGTDKLQVDSIVP